MAKIRRVRTLRSVVLSLVATITALIWIYNLRAHSNLTPSGSSLLAQHAFVHRKGHRLGQQQPRQGNATRPWFAIHIGPPKTGTTYLQTCLCKKVLATSMMERDDWHYMGTCPGRAPGTTVHHNIIHMFDPMLNKRFKRRIRNSHLKGTNVLLIFEGLSHINSTQIAELRDFVAPWFRLRVMAAYRPLYEWLPSKYNSLYKPARNPSARVWPGQLTSRNVSGKILLPFDMDRRGNFSSEVVAPIESLRLHVTHSSILAFQQQRIDAEVIHLPFASHNPKGGESADILEYLICNLLHARQTCRSLRNGEIRPEGSKNPSASFDGDIIAVAAYQSGLIPSSVSRKGARIIFESYYKRLVESLLRQQDTAHDNGSARTNVTTSNRTINAWMIKCLSDETHDRIFRLSWDTHCKLFCTDNQDDQEHEEQRHWQGFELNRHRFCSPNADRIVADSRFQRFVRENIKSVV